ncbi:hypothetical protein DPX16_18702 [Anabarilius grahami]|uniref:Secreted protein n=1 Tax=Anabarilius grahami TaxID=495550 RepID=A0A3N0Z2G8_ANAGA|nr:hypothetical protein DPX16_18702 [Anabarilius grahami]
MQIVSAVLLLFCLHKPCKVLRSGAVSRRRITELLGCDKALVSFTHPSLRTIKTLFIFFRTCCSPSLHIKPSLDLPCEGRMYIGLLELG